MAPLILHNVPDDELYVGEDGKQRPYAMVFPHHDGGHQSGVRGRRPVAETGAFGKSARRSRSKTATPARREDPTLAAADKVFTSWFEQQRKGNADDTAAGGPGSQRKSSGGGSPTDDGSSTAALAAATAAASAAAAAEKKTPVEVILRGFRSQAQQYAAINHYELLAGLICEDYPRDPPVENRRYKSELRDPAYTRRRRALAPEERVLVNRADGGEHWIKITFESAAAADTACSESPQSILGHWVYAEPYHGIPPARDEAIPVNMSARTVEDNGGESRRYGTVHGFPSRGPPRPVMDAGRGGGASTLPKSYTTSGLHGKLSPSNSHTSSTTLDTGTLNSFAESLTVSSGTVTQGPTNPGAATGIDSGSSPADGASGGPGEEDRIYCRKVPTVRRAKLLPAEQALLPQQSYAQQALNKIPFLKWFSGSMIGNEVPRTDLGDFDWDRASLYWKLIWWLDATFGLFGGEIFSNDKDE